MFTKLAMALVTTMTFLAVPAAPVWAEESPPAESAPAVTSQPLPSEEMEPPSAPDSTAPETSDSPAPATESAGPLPAPSESVAPPASSEPEITAAAGPALGPTADWELSQPVEPEVLGGYAVGESITPGDPLQLKIRGTAATVTVETFRMGHYDGLGASLAYHAADVPLTPQPACTVIDRTVDCSAWSVTQSIATDGWEPGLYLTRFTDGQGNQSYDATTIRSTSHTGAVTIMSATSTHAAYNTMGGYSLYQGPEGPDRAYTVSLNRPGEGSGAEKLIHNELGIIQHLESLGVQLSYTTNAALHRGSAEFAGSRALVTLGHDEYWSTEMRANAQTLRDQGTNLVFLGANSIFWRTRWNADFTRVTSYKSAALDPVNSAETTTKFRDEPYPNPEARLMGSQYDCDGSAPNTDLVITNPDFWAFRGTGVAVGTRYASLVGYEVDKAGPESPTSIHIAAHSTYQCTSRTGISDITYYVATSKAGVLNLGTMGLVHALSDSSPAPQRSIDFAKTVIATIITEAAQGPLGERLVEEANYSTIYPEQPFDVYSTPGYHTVNGRQWHTTCEAYSSQVDRCRTEIYATQVTSVNGRFVSKNGWYFNNLTYLASPRSQWTANPLGGYGKTGPLVETWTSGGREWKVECDTAVTGSGGCRAYIWGSFITSRLDSAGNRIYYWSKGWVFNNMVRFTS